MSNRIKELLEKKGWKQRDLATAIDKAESHVNQIIAGRFSPSLDTAQKIASALDSTVDEVFPSPEDIA